MINEKRAKYITLLYIFTSAIYIATSSNMLMDVLYSMGMINALFYFFILNDKSNNILSEYINIKESHVIKLEIMLLNFIPVLLYPNIPHGFHLFFLPACIYIGSVIFDKFILINRN